MRRLHWFLASLLAMGFGVLFAEEAGDDFRDSGESDELVVTAGRMREDILSVPAFVTVITADEIAESGAVNVVDVLETVPGVRFTDGTGGPGSETVSMRGFGENSFGRVLVLVDGKRLNNPDMKGINWNAIPLAAIERVEVLDGSGSARYGNNAASGVINIITKKTGEQRATLEIAGGNFFFNKASATYFEPTVWGGFSLSAEHTGTAGYRERQGAQVTNLTGNADIDISDTARLSLNASFADLFYQLPGGLTKEEWENDPAQAVNRADENTERDIGGGFQLSFFSGDALQIDVPFSYMGKYIWSNMVSVPSSYTDMNTNTFEARPQVTARFDLAETPFRFSGGLDFGYVRLDNTMYRDEARNLKKVHVIVNEINTAPYLTARIDVLPVLFLSGGLRYDAVSLAVATEPETIHESKTYDALAWDGGIVFKPLQNLKIYAKAGSLFRYPFTDEVASVYGTDMDSFYADLKPEKGFNTEAGFAFQWGRVLDCNAHIYYMVLTDELYYDSNSWENANMKDDTRRIGSNISVNSQPVSFLEFDAGVSWVNAVRLGDKEYEIPLVPAFTCTAGLTGKLPFGLSVGTNAEYRGKSYQGGDVTNSEEKIDGYILLGLRARYAPGKEAGHFALQCDIKNLLDIRHTSNVYSSLKGPAYYPGDGRTINVSLQYRF
jgi:iron complex outermembrane receptor protein